MAHSHKIAQTPRLEPLEPRQLLSGLPTFPLSHDINFVVNRGGGDVLIATLPKSHYTIAGDTGSNGPTLNTWIDWGDDLMSQAVLQRDAKGKIQVWATHAYTAKKKYTLKILDQVGSTPMQMVLKKSAVVVLNSQRGTTLNLTTGAAFTNKIISTIDRPPGFPTLTTPVSTFALPDGIHTLALRIDWGDGTITDGNFISDHGHYAVRGSHTYGAAGSYRIITFIEIRSTSDQSLVSGETISSTAHVADPRQHPHFTLPAHADITFGDLMNTSADSPGASAIFQIDYNTWLKPPAANATGGDTSGSTTSSGSTSSGAGSVNVSGGILTINAGGHLNLGSSYKLGDAGITYTADGDFSNAGPSGALASSLYTATMIHADGSLSIPGGTPTNLDPSAAAAYLTTIHSGILIFNLKITSDLMLSLLNTLPSDFAGTVVVRPADADLTAPALPNATILHPTPLSVTTITHINNPIITPINNPIVFPIPNPTTNPGPGTLTGGTLSTTGGIINPGTGSGTTGITLGSNTFTGGTLTTGNTSPDSLVLGGTFLHIGGTLAAVNAAGDVTSVTAVTFLSDTADPVLRDAFIAGIRIHADGSITSPSAALTPGDAATYLTTLSAATLIFNINTPSDLVTSLINSLPTDFTGNIVLPPGVADLTFPAPPGAVILHPILLNPGTSLNISGTNPIIITGVNLATGTGFTNTGGGAIIVNSPIS